MNDSVWERRRTRGFKAGAGVTANVARLLRAVTNAPANDAQPHGQGPGTGSAGSAQLTLGPPALSPRVLGSCSSSFLSIQSTFFSLAAADQS